MLLKSVGLLIFVSVAVASEMKGYKSLKKNRPCSMTIGAAEVRSPQAGNNCYNHLTSIRVDYTDEKHPPFNYSAMKERTYEEPDIRKKLEPLLKFEDTSMGWAAKSANLQITGVSEGGKHHPKAEYFYYSWDWIRLSIRFHTSRGQFRHSGIRQPHTTLGNSRIRQPHMASSNSPYLRFCLSKIGKIPFDVYGRTFVSYMICEKKFLSKAKFSPRRSNAVTVKVQKKKYLLHAFGWPKLLGNTRFSLLFESLEEASPASEPIPIDINFTYFEAAIRESYSRLGLGSTQPNWDLGGASVGLVAFKSRADFPFTFDIKIEDFSTSASPETVNQFYDLRCQSNFEPEIYADAIQPGASDGPMGFEDIGQFFVQMNELTL